MAPPPPNTSARGTSLYSSDPDLRRFLSALLAARGQGPLRQAETEAFLAAPADPAARLVVLDVGEGAVLEDARLFEARERLADVPLVVISGELSPDRARSLGRLRATDWLQRPVAEADFLGAVVQAEGRARPSHSRVVTVIGASGGAGATTVALMAAGYLAQRAADTTCLVDLDFQSASVGAYLNAESEFDLTSVIDNPERLDGELLSLVELQVPSGLKLFSMERPDLFFAPTGRRFVLGLLDLVATRYAEIVIDLPNLQTPWFDEVVRTSDRVLLVFEVNIPSLRQARRTATRLRDVRGGWEGIVAIGNKAGFKLLGNPIAPRDVARMLPETPPQFLPGDAELTREAMNRAQLPAEVAPRSALVRTATKLFGEILG
jgi:pilus assembly protein CpaE